MHFVDSMPLCDDDLSASSSSSILLVDPIPHSTIPIEPITLTHDIGSNTVNIAKPKRITRTP